MHFVVCLTRPQPLPKPVLRQVRSSVSSCNFQYPIVSFRLSSSCLLLLPRLPITSNYPLSFHSITCIRRPVPTQDFKNAIRIFLSSFSYNSQYTEYTQQLREKNLRVPLQWVAKHLCATLITLRQVM